MNNNTKRRSYHLPERSIALLEEIAKHYGHGSLTSALAGCVQHVYMTIPKSRQPHLAEDTLTNNTEDDNQPSEDDVL